MSILCVRASCSSSCIFLWMPFMLICSMVRFCRFIVEVEVCCVVGLGGVVGLGV